MIKRFLLFFILSIALGCSQSGFDDDDGGGGDGPGGPDGPGGNAGTEYELVMRIDQDGTVLQGAWDTAYDRIINRLDDCILRFGNRLAKPKHIEYTSNSIRFDFISLNGVYDSWDDYAFVLVEENIQAGVGVNSRRGTPLEVWKKDLDQHIDDVFNGSTIEIYCPGSKYTSIASFNTAGAAISGSWDAMHNAVTTKGANVKVKVDNRILMPPHVEYGDDYVNFDTLGLAAHHNSNDAYAYANVINNTRAGIGARLRRAIATEIWKKDADQDTTEDFFRGMNIEVFTEDVYTKEFIMNDAGMMWKGDWNELYDLVVNQGVDCKIKFDNRISNPQYIEFGLNSLEFDFHNLQAWHNSSDNYESYALVILDYSNEAKLSASYRRSFWSTVWKKSIEQHPLAYNNPMTITVLCNENSGYKKEVSLMGDGSEMFGSHEDLYNNLTNADKAHWYKIRLDNRITMPEVIEYGNNYTEKIFFDYNSLSAYVSTWNCFATTVLEYGVVNGITGTYRRGDHTVILKSNLDQHALYTMQDKDLDIFIR
ncbi:MAG: hypothetical protein GY754_10045 [bacterium]|nr:hypothetical protein [bacterium]